MKAKALIKCIMPRFAWHWLADAKIFLRVQFARYYQIRNVRRIRLKIRRGEKIRVLFLDSEVAKWKTQSLFDAMKNDDRYSPVIGISVRDSAVGSTAEEIYDGIVKAKEYYERHGNKCVVVFDAEKRCKVDLRVFNPDIVFYQQSWYSEGAHDIYEVQKFALTCCVPYFTPNYGFPMIESQMLFHRYLGFYFLLNEGWVRAYRELKGAFYYAGRFVAVGHTMLDNRRNVMDAIRGDGIIYAPHFSFDYREYRSILHMSSFLENGEMILEYARRHLEFTWYFKPHPVLYTALIKSGVWSKERVDRYYQEWRKIGRVCLDGDYWGLFDKAAVMVTDCGSFLVEFATTGKPIIHLIARTNNHVPMKPSKDLFETYYDVHNEAELFDMFKMVIENKLDPKRGIRLAAVRRANLQGTNAAKNIMDFFDAEFGIKC